MPSRGTRTPTTTAATTPPDGGPIAARIIRAALNWSYPPCDDFYNFVCSNFSGDNSAITKIGRETEKAIREMLDTMRIPETSQKPTEKAAALYQACIRLGNDPHGSQVDAVQSFLSHLGLDIANLTPDPYFDIFGRLVNLSFIHGFPTFVSFSAYTDLYRHVTIEILINKDDEDWIKNQHKKYDSPGLARFYMSYLNVYNSSLDSAPLVARIIQSELTVGAFLVTLRNSWSLTFYNTLDQLGYRTRGYVSQGRWVSAIAQATANVYNGSTFVLMKQNSTSLVVFLLNRNRISLEDSRLLMSWSLVHQLLPLAYGQMMDSELIELPDRRDRVAYLCYQHIIGVMALAVSERYFSTHVPLSALHAASHLANNVLKTLKSKLAAAEWVQDDLFCVMEEITRHIWFLMGYPDGLETASLIDFYFEFFPDVGANFTAGYLAARRAMTTGAFQRRFNVSFDPATVNAFYAVSERSILIFAGILQPPIFIHGAPVAVNYGGIGQITGHELMHAYDVYSVRREASQRVEGIQDTPSMQQYISKVLCLRESYKQAESEERGRTYHGLTDAEGVADWGGIQLAYDTYRSLTDDVRTEVVPGVDLTAEQTFFIFHCLKFCTTRPGTRRGWGLYWHGRSRCIVPLRNMPEFAEAFSCKRGDRMNPDRKCTFWP
ncbi:neprilysin-3-like [Amblyomma americanum]